MEYKYRTANMLGSNYEVAEISLIATGKLMKNSVVLMPVTVSEDRELNLVDGGLSLSNNQALELASTVIQELSNTNDPSFKAKVIDRVLKTLTGIDKSLVSINALGKFTQ
jgi:hypothetical protein